MSGYEVGNGINDLTALLTSRAHTSPLLPVAFVGICWCSSTHFNFLSSFLVKLMHCILVVLLVKQGILKV
jgi:hypothetical protein